MSTDCQVCCFSFDDGTSTTHWTPRDPDIYVPSVWYNFFCAKLENLGYFVVEQSVEDDALYTFSHIQQVITFSDSVRKLDVVISNSPATFMPIFQFHSTAVMNFVSPDRVFCAYPHLTFRGLSMINHGPV